LSPTPPRAPILVLGLDGASFDVIDPLVAEGRLPNLACWMQEGCARPLCSTTPPMSFPAWTTFMTGVEPGEHGVFDFTQKAKGAYRIDFVNGSHRRVPTLFGRAKAAGLRVLALGVPATYPPEPVDGLLVAGFDAPVSTGTDERSASDPALYREIANAVGPWKRPDLDESARDGGFYERAAETLLGRVESKTRFALEALRRLCADGTRPDLVVVVFAESDTVAHHYWRDHDPGSPRHDPSADASRRGAIAAVYERLDSACGELHAALGDDVTCVVLSDHGAGGAARCVVHLNRRLEEAGLLQRRGPSALDGAAKFARDTALRVLPPAVAQWVFRRARGAAARVESAARFGGLDWARTRAFSEEVNTQPGVWINLRGREAAGCVGDDDYERVRDEVITALLEWKLPSGGPVVAAARRREEVYAGPHTDLAPDIVVELALDEGYGLSVVPTPWAEHGNSVTELAEHELGGGRGRGMNGTHRQDGIWVADASAAAWLGEKPRLADVAPALLRALGAHDSEPDVSEGEAQRYSEEEEARVAARLRALGYLD
jgi:predicted AlkP superfamily phosphohydrolase/phosphomutase